MLSADEFASLVFGSLPRANEAPEPDLQLAAVPAWSAPRWLIPADTTVAGIALAKWSPYRVTSRIQWTALRAAQKTGVLKLLSGTTHTRVATGAIDWQSLGWNSLAPPVPVIYIGTPSPSRKAVIQLVDPITRSVKLVVKVPLADGAKISIIRESEILLQLNGRYSFAPQVVFLDHDRGIASQTPLEGKSAPRNFLRQYWPLFESLMLPGTATTLGEKLVAVQQQVQQLQLSTTEGSLVRKSVANIQDSTPLPACWEHGDFAPWNVRVNRNGDILLLDWEDAVCPGLPLLDAFHFMHIQDYLFRHKPESHWRDVDGFAGRLQISPQFSRALEIFYLVRAFVRKKLQPDSSHAMFLEKTLGLLVN